MKTRILKITLALMVIAGILNAQETKKVHLKLVKEINGEKTVVDTIIEGDDTQDYLFYTLDKEGDINLDSLLKDVDIEKKEGMKVIKMKIKDKDCDSEKKMWVTVTADGDDDHVVVKLDADATWVDSDGDLTIVGDSIKVAKEIFVSSGDKDMIFIGDDAKKIKMKVDSDDKYTWTIDSSDVKMIKVDKDIILRDNEEGKFNIYISESDEGVKETVSEVYVTKGEGKSKTIELIMDADDENDHVKLIDLHEKMEKSGENVVITKYKTEDGKIIIKAEIAEDNLSIKEKKSSDCVNINIDYNSKGKVKLEFKLENKETTVVKIVDNEGKTIFKEKIKDFNGSYSKEIDLSKEQKGIYFIKIIQGEKTITEKLTIK